jgi:hypothetical protein
VKRLLILAGATLLFAACAESPTSPSTGRRIAPSGANHDDDFKCASGYVVAYDENGNPYCTPEGDEGRSSSSTGTNGAGSVGARGAASTMGGPP